MERIREDIEVSINEQLEDFEILSMLPVLDTIKQTERVLVLLEYKLLMFTYKAPSKIDQVYHLMDLSHVESASDKLIKLEFSSGKTASRTICLSTAIEFDVLIQHILSIQARIYPSQKPWRYIFIDISPTLRSKKLLNFQNTKLIPACDGMAEMYKLICDKMDIDYNNDVIWDIENNSLMNKEFRIQDYAYYDYSHILPIIKCLNRNAWFKTLNLSGEKMHTDILKAVLQIMNTNEVIDCLDFSDTGIKSDFIREFVDNSRNIASRLKHLNISNNGLDDKALLFLCPYINQCRKLISLSMAGNYFYNFNKFVIESLSCNTSIQQTLVRLDISNNSMKIEDTPALYNFLSVKNNIEELNLKSCDLLLNNLFESLLNGCRNIKTLNLSSNSFKDPRKIKSTDYENIKQFFYRSKYLQSIDLSNTKINSNVLKKIMEGLLENKKLSDGIQLNLASNFTASSSIEASAILCSHLTDISTINSLDISDNYFDKYMIDILISLKRNSCVKHLYIGGHNFSNLKQKQMTAVLMLILDLMIYKSLNLKTLSLAGARIKSNIALIFNAIHSNCELEYFDLSGNHMSDHDVFLLSKSLVQNKNLRRLNCDKNNLSPNALLSLSYALQKNRTIRRFDLPLHDISNAIKLNATRTEASVKMIEHCISRNQYMINTDSTYIFSTVMDRKFTKLNNFIKKSLKLQMNVLETENLQGLIKVVTQIRKIVSDIHDLVVKNLSLGVTYQQLIDICILESQLINISDFTVLEKPFCESEISNIIAEYENRIYSDKSDLSESIFNKIADNIIESLLEMFSKLVFQKNKEAVVLRKSTVSIVEKSINSVRPPSTSVYDEGYTKRPALPSYGVCTDTTIKELSLEERYESICNKVTTIRELSLEERYESICNKEKKIQEVENVKSDASLEDRLKALQNDSPVAAPRKKSRNTDRNSMVISDNKAAQDNKHTNIKVPSENIITPILPMKKAPARPTTGPMMMDTQKSTEKKTLPTRPPSLPATNVHITSPPIPSRLIDTSKPNSIPKPERHASGHPPIADILRKPIPIRNAQSMSIADSMSTSMTSVNRSVRSSDITLSIVHDDDKPIDIIDGNCISGQISKPRHSKRLSFEIAQDAHKSETKNISQTSKKIDSDDFKIENKNIIRNIPKNETKIISQTSKKIDSDDFKIENKNIIRNIPKNETKSISQTLKKNDFDDTNIENKNIIRNSLKREDTLLEDDVFFSQVSGGPKLQHLNKQRPKRLKTRQSNSHFNLASEIEQTTDESSEKQSTIDSNADSQESDNKENKRKGRNIFASVDQANKLSLGISNFFKGKKSPLKQHDSETKTVTPETISEDITSVNKEKTSEPEIHIPIRPKLPCGAVSVMGHLRPDDNKKMLEEMQAKRRSFSNPEENKEKHGLAPHLPVKLKALPPAPPKKPGALPAKPKPPFKPVKPEPTKKVKDSPPPAPTSLPPNDTELDDNKNISKEKKIYPKLSLDGSIENEELFL